MTRALLAGALVAAGTANAAGELRPVALPSPLVAPAPVPPLVLAAQPLVETEAVTSTLGVRTHQRVLVALDGGGRVRSVQDVYRMILRGTADYSYAIGAPLVSVAAAPGSATEPGQRGDALLWQGFSPGRRTLAARATLRREEAERALPVGVEIEQRGGETVLRLVNTTRTRASGIAADADAADVARVLDELRRDRGYRSQPFVNVRGEVGPRTLEVSAHLAVAGRARAGAGPWTQVLGTLDDAPLTVRLRGRGPLSLWVEVRPVAPRAMLTPPAGTSSWTDAVRRGTAPPPRELLDLAVRTLLETARTRQYNSFLQTLPLDPQPRAVYVYRTTAERAQGNAAPPANGAERDLGLTIALVAVGLLGAAALAVAWAHA